MAPRVDKSRTVDESRGSFDRSGSAVRREPQGLDSGRVTSRSPVQRVPDRSASNIVPRKARVDEASRGGIAFHRGDRDSRFSSPRRDSYLRWGRDRHWNEPRYRPGHGRHGYHYYPRHGYRSCYAGYFYSYPRLYPLYPYRYYGASLFYDPYAYGGYYDRGYSVVTYDTMPATYTTYNTTVYETAPVESNAQSYGNPGAVQSYAPSYQEAPPAYSTPAPAPSAQTYTQPSGDATLTPPSAVPEAQAPAEPEYQEPEAVRQGHQHFGKGEYKEAQAAFLRGVLADSRDAYARLFYGMAGVAVGDYAAAAASVRSALELAPDLIEQPIDLRQFFRDADTVKAHLDGLTDWLQTRSGESESRLTLAYLLFATGDAEGADRELSRLDTGSTVDQLANRLRESIAQVKAAMSQPPPSDATKPPAQVAPAIP